MGTVLIEDSTNKYQCHKPIDILKKKDFNKCGEENPQNADPEIHLEFGAQETSCLSMDAGSIAGNMLKNTIQKQKYASMEFPEEHNHLQISIKV